MARRNIITFELRAAKDDDLTAALAVIPKSIERSDIIRAALRQYLDLGGSVEPIEGVTCNLGEINRIGGALLAEVQLSKKEKSADEIDDAITRLLGL